ncbi:MAG: hypothetical protein WC509_03110 [Candidatus Izemoplasmatales bacterium]
MRGMLRIQGHYLIDGTAAAFIGLLAVFVAAATAAASEFWLGSAMLDLDRAERAFAYRTQGLLAIRLGVCVLSIFLGLHGYSRVQRRAAAFFVSSRDGLFAFGVAKGGAAGLTLVGFTLAVGLAYSAVGILGTPYFSFTATDLRLIADALCEGFLLLFLQGIVTTLWDSAFAALPACALFWVLEANAHDPTVPWVEAALTLVRHGRIGPEGPATYGDPLVHVGVVAFAYAILSWLFARKDVN